MASSDSISEPVKHVAIVEFFVANCLKTQKVFQLVL